MIGKNPKFNRFECDPFELPKQLLLSDCRLKNERDFIEFLVRNEWIQRRIGLRMPRVTNGFFPDLKCVILPDSEHPKEEPISVEVEFWAENYSSHGHPFKGCDLIISFFRTPDTVFVKGVPVWSFYECYRNDKWGIFTLDSDIRYDFKNHVDPDLLFGMEAKVYQLRGEIGLKTYRKNKAKQEKIDDSIGG